MKKLSYWASRHTSLAILLIIIGEVANGFNGVILGATLLDKIPLVRLTASMLALMGIAIFIQLYPSHTSLSANYWIGRRWLFVAFLSNFLLFGLLGGIWNQHAQTIHARTSVLGGRQIIVVGDSLSPANSVRQSTQIKKMAPSDSKESGPRGVYIALGVLGIAVTYFWLL